MERIGSCPSWSLYILCYYFIRGCALTSWINYKHVAICLYGRTMAQPAPHTRLVVLCEGCFMWFTSQCLQVYVQLGAPVPGAKYAVWHFSEYHWLVMHDLCGSQLSSVNIGRQMTIFKPASACEIRDGMVKYEASYTHLWCQALYNDHPLLTLYWTN